MLTPRASSIQLILGSSSPYRRDLLARLRLPFQVHSPQVDETALAGEQPAHMATRLAMAKAQAVASQYPNALVIGSDQVVDFYGKALGKPHTHEQATAQLRSMRGQTVVFHTALALVCQQRSLVLSALVPTTVRWRDVSDEEIEGYLLTEKPYDCAGSAKSEGLGISLLSHIESSDPTALIGLPLIQTCTLLRQAGLNPLVP
jgi:septum formation protein